MHLSKALCCVCGTNPSTGGPCCVPVLRLLLLLPQDFPTTHFTFEAWISSSDFCHAGETLSTLHSAAATGTHAALPLQLVGSRRHRPAQHRLRQQRLSSGAAAAMAAGSALFLLVTGCTRPHICAHCSRRPHADHTTSSSSQQSPTAPLPVAPLPPLSPPQALSCPMPRTVSRMMMTSGWLTSTTLSSLTRATCWPVTTSST